jgi:hypothetical protein
VIITPVCYENNGASFIHRVLRSRNSQVDRIKKSRSTVGRWDEGIDLGLKRIALCEWSKKFRTGGEANKREFVPETLLSFRVRKRSQERVCRTKGILFTMLLLSSNERTRDTGCLAWEKY